jgi:hypothetical protein
MLRKTIVAMAMTTLAGIAIAADKPAADQTPGLDKRQENQERRIENGVNSGQLNQRETTRLEHAEDRLETNEAKAKADGKVTARERARLHTEARANSARIAKQKHDAQGTRTAKKRIQ